MQLSVNITAIFFFPLKSENDDGKMMHRCWGRNSETPLGQTDTSRGSESEAACSQDTLGMCSSPLRQFSYSPYLHFHCRCTCAMCVVLPVCCDALHKAKLEPRACSLETLLHVKLIVFFHRRPH